MINAHNREDDDCNESRDALTMHSSQADGSCITTGTSATSAEDTGGGGSTPTSASSLGSKEKRGGWFHSLTRRRKSQTIVASDSPPPTLQNNINNNNNNDSLLQPPAGLEETTNESLSTIEGLAVTRKRKEDKSIFQRLRQKMGSRFQSIRQRRQLSAHGDDDDETDCQGATTDASSEFFTRSGGCLPSPASHPLKFNFANSGFSTALPLEEMEEDSQPFTHHFKRFIAKKWKDGEGGPNRVMYRACSEMLSQVWYWGSISRRDAQKVLTTKPSGSFLVRDSESSGCQFTLSFRICNVTLHYRLEHRNNYWHFEELQYESIVEMVEDILTRCTKNNFICFVSVPNEMQPQFPVILKYPLSRYMVMPTLQDLCRRMIQRHVAPSQIVRLPVPPQLLEYLRESRELVF